MQDKSKLFTDALVHTLISERKERGLSQEAISKKAGITRQAIGLIESGKRNPTMLTMYKITQAIDISLSDFVKRAEDK